MRTSLPTSRRRVLAGLACLGLAPTLVRADDTAQNGDIWTPDALGERVYRYWEGDLDEVVPFDPLAFKANRSVVVIFRSDLDFYVNGSERPQPSVNVSDGTVTVQWARNRAQKNEITFPVEDGWHCLVSRRYKGKHYASLDGSPELVVGENIVCPRFKNPKRPDGYVSGNAKIWLLQGEMTAAEAQKFMGWACHEHQISLQTGHPYENQPPMIGIDDWKSTFIEPTEAEWATLGYNTTHEGEPLDLTGFSVVFEDDFTEMNVYHEDEGPGPWWAPVHGSGVGGAQQGFVDDDPPVFIQQGSELVLQSYRRPNGRWKAGIFCSINQAGDGNTWTPPFYIEWVLRCSPAGNLAGFPAVWVKSVNEYFMVTETTIELDVWEGRNRYPDFYHPAYHNHEALRPLPGRLQSDRFHSANLYPGEMYDNGYHSYAVKIDDGWIVHYFDGAEVARNVAHPQVYQPFFILVDNAVKRRDKDSTDEPFEMGIDRITVMQRT